MTTCEVLITGGGPAGSACAWRLRKAGADVIVMDRATFPRDKVCAGWITPQVVADLHLDLDEYRRGRTFQPFTGFRIGTIGGARAVDISYARAVSFGIRRCEFDQYLLQRSGARTNLGEPIARVRRDGSQWIINETIKAPMLVGAGGHFCPVARWLNGPLRDADAGSLVAAQEVEFAIDPRQAASFPTVPEMPELYFCPDLRGYGWVVRKQDHLNIGFGRLDRRSLPKATAEFVGFLEDQRKVPRAASWRWHGHAYLVHGELHRRVLDSGVMLIGDAAGLAYARSGEGIRPAIESGLLAAATILEASGQYTRDRLTPYAERLRARFGTGGSLSYAAGRIAPAAAWAPLARGLLRMPPFVRHIVLDRWFLHANEPALAFP